MSDVLKLELKSGVYLIGYADASVALRAGAKLAKVLAPSFAKAGGDLESALANVLGAEGFEDLVDYLAKAFAPFTQLVLRGEDGKTTSHTLAEVYEIHFRGKLGDLVKWLSASVRHNLASFFDELLSVKADAQAAAAKA